MQDEIIFRIELEQNSITGYIKQHKLARTQATE